jgi:hypothetical protein
MHWDWNKMLYLLAAALTEPLQRMLSSCPNTRMGSGAHATVGADAASFFDTVSG